RRVFCDASRASTAGTWGPRLRGLVFAAAPPQLAPDIWTYERGLAGWYGDAPFWEDMKRYVRFWAQERSAEVRSSPVGGSTLGERAASLNDYFLHGTKLAASTDAAAR